MIRKLSCWLGWHEWRYVGRRTIFDILDGKPETKFICEHCGKIKK